MTSRRHDFDRSTAWDMRTVRGKGVAIIGSGPAGFGIALTPPALFFPRQ